MLDAARVGLRIAASGSTLRSLGDLRVALAAMLADLEENQEM
jgi:hypothetical protein